MTLRSRSGLGARGVYFLIFAVAALALGRYLYLQLPVVQAGDTSVLLLTPHIVVILVLLIGMVWALVGGHEDWVIADRHIRIRSKCLTSWGRTIVIYPEQIEEIERVQHHLGGDTDNGLPSASILIILKDGQRFESPRIFDDTKISRAWRKVEALMQASN